MQKLLLSVTFVACFMLGHCSPHHKPLQILTISNGTLNPNTANLQFIMGQVPRNMEVAVLSIAGEMRKGKSFVLNFFLQYLKYRARHDRASIVTNITEAFEKIDAFALPFPGSKVTNKKFDGALEKIDIEFLLHLQDAVTNIVEGSEPKKRLGMNLIAGDVESYVQDIANIFNNQLPPDEIMKMNERQVTMRAYNETQLQVDEYRTRMQAMFQDKNDTFFENTTANGLLKAIMQMHEETSTSIVSSFASNSFSGFLTHTDTNGSAVSAHQWLERTISDQFEIIRPRLMSIANERTAAIILKRKAEEERLRLDQEQQRLAKEKAEKEAEVRRLEVEAEQKRKEREQIEKQRQEAEAKVKLQQVTLKQAEEQAARDKEERERLEKQQAEMAEAHRKQQELIAEKSRQAEIDRLDRERIEQERKRLEEQNRKQEQELAQKLAEAKEQQRRDNEMRDRMHRMEVEAARMAERVRAAERNRCHGLGCLFG